MQRLGNQLFPHPGRPRDQDTAEVWCDAANLRNELKHERATANHSIEFEILKKFILQFQAALAMFRILFNLADSFPELVGGKWLGEIICGALLNRLHRGFRRVIACHQDDIHALHTWHDEVEKDDLRASFANKFHTALRVGRSMNIKTLVCQNEPYELNVRGVVVDNYEDHV